MNIRSLSGLKHLDVSGCKIKTLDLTECPELETLFCAECGLTELDVKGNPQLRVLRCDGNQLEALDISKCSKLAEMLEDTESYMGYAADRPIQMWTKQQEQEGSTVQILLVADADLVPYTGSGK